MKKIAIFCDFQLPVPAVCGGAVQQLTTTLLDLNEIDHRYDFEVYSPYNKDAKVLGGGYKYTKFYFSKFMRFIRIYTNTCFKLHFPMDLSALPLSPGLAYIFKHTKYDAVYVSGYIRGILTISQLNNGRCPIYYHHHVVTDILNENSIRGGDIFAACEKLGFVSQYACDKAKTGNAELDKKLTVFRNVIDVKRFMNLPKETRNSVRKMYGFNDTDVVLVFVGRFVENKGVLQLLKAFKKCKQGCKNAKLLLVGGATYNSNATTNYVQQCIDIARDMKNDVIITGYIPNNQLPSILTAADIGCVPSVYEEACGLTALEMMASGLPIITTGAAGLSEYVKSGCKEVSEWHCGMNKDDIIVGLTDAICNLVHNEEKRAIYGKVGKKSVQNFDVGKYLDMFDSFINS